MVHSALGVHISAAAHTFFLGVRPMCAHFPSHLSLRYSTQTHGNGLVRTALKYGICAAAQFTKLKLSSMVSLECRLGPWQWRPLVVYLPNHHVCLPMTPVSPRV